MADIFFFHLGGMSTIQVLLSPALVSKHASEACVTTQRKWTAIVGCRLEWTPLCDDAIFDLLFF